MASSALTSGRRSRAPTLRSLIAIAIVAACIAWSVRFGDAGGFLLVSSYGVLGLVLALRRPAQPLAWLLILIAIGLAVGTTRPTASLEELRSGSVDALGAVTAWANGIGWAFIFAGFLGILLVFPEGTFPVGRWRVVGVATVGAYVLIAAMLLFGPFVSVTLPVQPNGIDVPNPFAPAPLRGLAGLIPSPVTLWPLLFVTQLVAMTAMFARFRRSEGLVRLQYRWLWWAVVVVIVGNLAWVAVTIVLDVQISLLAAIIIGVTYPAIPVAIVVAVLRYRLYEIDRLVSRTLGWALATASVVGVFVVAVLALQAALAGFTQGQTLATAASTLLAFAAFQPIRRRVQAVVDRRFDRPRVAAERSLAEHGDRMQHEVDLATLSRDVEETINAALRPSSAAVWIRRS